MKTDASRPVIITLDGPGGSGKGTIAKIIASKLGFHYLDSGALYRLLALAASKHSVSLENADALEVLAGHMDIEFRLDSDHKLTIFLESEEVSEVIRSESCGDSASKIAAMPVVRAALLQRQRDFSRAPGLVTDGRDMGTVVFPEADYKFFLTADIKERAKRRYDQLKQAGLDVNLTQLSTEIAERDKRDKTRKVSPLVAAKQAIEVDTTSLSVTQTLDYIQECLKPLFTQTGAVS